MQLKITKSKKYYEEAKKLIPACTQTLSKQPEYYAYGNFPIYTNRGQGSHVWDVDGYEYIDYIMSLGPITLGYCYPATDNAVRKQLKNGIMSTLLSPLEVEAAKAIKSIIPCGEMSRFFKTGAESTAAAARVARAYTGKYKILSCGYHGWLDVWSAEKLKQGLPNGRGIIKEEAEYIFPFKFNDYNSKDSVGYLLEKHKGEVACIIMEPVTYSQVDNGEYLQWVRKLADKHGVLLIIDEIVTGFRLSLAGGQGYFKVVPDLACFAKGIANGMPVAALTGKKKYMQIMDGLMITTTYGGEALSLAAIVSCINEYRNKGVIRHLWEMGTMLMEGVNKMSEEIGIKFKFFGYAPMSCFNFFYEDSSLNQKLQTLFLQECAKRGVLFRKGGLVFITYSHSQKDISRTLKVCLDSLKIIKKAYDENKIDKILKVTKVKESVRKF